ncbi:hypothetical protein E2C01_094047 [Portunus trituberculatus]|uniref:Uncharacterized protein n=1 Tax=Portunus trituberculatus TaxID=210409 RepID=A0A5B7K0F1_PORTR|nr:hypothetical protein [Portunus trituberculatus]
MKASVAMSGLFLPSGQRFPVLLCSLHAPWNVAALVTCPDVSRQQPPFYVSAALQQPAVNGAPISVSNY